MFLVAVVLVFTVCQIPQAISLTLQSFFPTLAQSSQVLIYNNFANCLVAVNASINFLLYCCFSDRFRSTFQSNFTFLNKYFVHHIQPKWQPNEIDHQPKYSISIDNMSNYSLHGNQINTCASNINHLDFNSKYLTSINQTCDVNEHSWFNCLSKLIHCRRRQKPTSNIDRTLESIQKHSTKIKKLSPKNQLLPNNNKELIWVKRRQSHGTIEQFLNRQNSSSRKDIIDVTV